MSARQATLMQLQSHRVGGYYVSARHSAAISARAAAELLRRRRLGECLATSAAISAPARLQSRCVGGGYLSAWQRAELQLHRHRSGGYYVSARQWASAQVHRHRDGGGYVSARQATLMQRRAAASAATR